MSDYMTGIRHAEASDYGSIIAVLNDWWDGRSMADMLPKVFFVHFRDTSFVAEQYKTCQLPCWFSVTNSC